MNDNEDQYKPEQSGIQGFISLIILGGVLKRWENINSGGINGYKRIGIINNPPRI